MTKETLKNVFIQNELIAYLSEGNSKEDLAKMYLDNLNSIQRKSLMNEVADAHEIAGIFAPYVSREMGR